jgi:hypothetical protein
MSVTTVSFSLLTKKRYSQRKHVYFSTFSLKITVVISSIRKPKRIMNPKGPQKPSGVSTKTMAKNIPKRSPHRIPWGAQCILRLLTPMVNPITEWWIREETLVGQKGTPGSYLCIRMQTKPKIAPQTVATIIRLFRNVITSFYVGNSIHRSRLLQVKKGGKWSTLSFTPPQQHYSMPPSMMVWLFRLPLSIPDSRYHKNLFSKGAAHSI